MKGYSVVGLSKNGELKKYLVHRLVAKAFIQNTNKCPEINHIDLNKSNNHMSNLQWVTHQRNLSHAAGMGVFDFRKGLPTNFNLKSVKVIDTDTGKTYNSMKDAAKSLGYSRWKISDLLNNPAANSSLKKLIP